jgi:hypothetical protein
VFSIFLSIHKIGKRSGGTGWIWYNYWFARGSYVKLCKAPITTEYRHYYESWLGDCGDKSLLSCYVTDTPIYGNIGTYYSPYKDTFLSL